MKLIIAIIQDKDEDLLGQAFLDAEIRATKLSTTGGFLRAGNTTFMIGTEDSKVDQVLQLIEDNCKRRDQIVPSPASYDINMSQAIPIEVEVGGAIVFVLPVDQFIRF